MRVVPVFALCALLTASVSPAVMAQQDAAPPAEKKAAAPAPPAGPFGPGGILGNAQFAPLIMGLGSAFGGTADLTHSNATNLLQRNDVRTELLLTAQQREKLDAMKAANQQELLNRVRTSAIENFKGLQGAAPEERKQLVEDGLGKLQDTVQTFQSDVDKHLDELLTLKATGGLTQTERLRQLDLQWRGPLALSEKKLAEALALTADQKSKVASALASYMQAQTTGMMKAFTSMQQAQQGGAAPGAGPGGPPAFNMQDMQKRMAEAMQSDEIKKARKDAEKQVVSALTPDQTQTWKSWLGRPFTFRANND